MRRITENKSPPAYCSMQYMVLITVKNPDILAVHKLLTCTFTVNCHYTHIFLNFSSSSLSPSLLSLFPCHVSPVTYLFFLLTGTLLSLSSPQAVPFSPVPPFILLPACVALCAPLPFMTCNPCLLNKVPVPLRVENEP